MWIDAGDDVGRERLCRYGARPALSLERLRRLPGGRFAYRVKYACRGRAKHRVLTSMELLARLAALIPPPRYPLVRYSGVLAPRSAWRKDVVPKARVVGGSPSCDSRAETNGGADSRTSAPDVSRSDARVSANDRRSAGAAPYAALDGRQSPSLAVPASALGVHAGGLAPNVLSVRHWERLLGGALYAATSRVDWVTRLRRTFWIDVLECPTCHGRLRVLGSVTERDAVLAVLERLAMPTAAPRAARARDPTDDEQLGEADGG